MRALITVGAAWLLGLAAYEACLRVFWNQSMGTDWRSVALSSAVALGVTAPTIYWPAMRVVRRLRGGYRPIALFVITAIAIGIVPTALILWFWSGRLSDILSAEARIFYVMFSIVGVVVGIGYAFRRESVAQL